MKKILFSYSILSGLGAAILFGASTPFAKLLVGNISPILLAGLLYFGSGIGLFIVRVLRDRGWSLTGLNNTEWFWLAGAIIFGGVLGPMLLMLGLVYSSAAMASLLLNIEGVATAVLAWVFFKEHTDYRMVIGMLLIVLGGVVLAWPNQFTMHQWVGPLLIIGACFCWGIDNNLTRKISASDSLFIAGSKGLVAGIVNTSLAVALAVRMPSWSMIGYSFVIGFLGYGLSLVLFVLALRGLGTARTGAYFSTAPFIGALIAVVFFQEPTSALFWISFLLMAIGVWIHFTEIHDHTHTHEKLFHQHMHYHDEHHQHEHDFDWDGKEPHSHPHQHEEITHAHHHFPGIHHRHKH